MWIFHYLSIFTQISVIVPPVGMVIMKMPDSDVSFMSLLKIVFIPPVCSYFRKFDRKCKKHAGFQFLLIDSHPRVTYMFLL